jgi:hypothetical protein
MWRLHKGSLAGCDITNLGTLPNTKLHSNIVVETDAPDVEKMCYGGMQLGRNLLFQAAKPLSRQDTLSSTLSI